MRGHVSVRRGGRPAGAAAQPHFGRAAHPGGAQGPQHEHAALVFRLGADLRGAGHHGPAGGVGRRALAMDRAFVGGAARGRRRAVLPRAAGPQKRRRPAPAAAGAGPQRRVLRAAGGHRAGRRGRGDHGPVGVGLFGKGPAAAKAGGRRVGRVLFLADACAGAQRLCGAGRARAAAPAAHRRQRRGRRAVRGLRACTKPSAGGAGLRAYGPLCQPAVAGRDHSCVPAHPLRGGGHVRAAFRGRRCGRVPGGVLRGPRGGLGAGVRHGVCGGRGGVWGAARGPAAGGGVPAAVLRRAHGAALHRSAGRLTRRERTAAQAIEESCFSNRNRRLQTGAKDRKMNKRRGLHGRAVFVPGGQPQSGERDAVSGSTNWDLAL